MTRSLGGRCGGRLPQKPSATRTELTNNRVSAGHNSTQRLLARSFRCGEDREARQRRACTRTTRPAASSEDGAEELLLPERVLGGGDGHDEGVLSYVGVAVRHQVCSCFGNLKR